MKAIVKQNPAPGLWWEDVPAPEISDNEVLIKPKKTAICGTDIHIYKWDAWSQKNVPTPLVIGHEFMGEVIKVGERVEGISVGDRVSGEGHITCGKCRHCMTERRHLCPHTKGIGYHLPGCFAESFKLPQENVFKIPENIPDDVAAIFDPLGNAIHTALSTNLVGQDVLITGAGPIGLMAIPIVQRAGARHVVITDLNDYRLDIARKMGVSAAVNVTRSSVEEAIEKLGMKIGFDVGLEMSGSFQALSTLIDNLQPGGHISLLGVLPPGGTIDWDKVIFKMLNIKGIYGREIFATWYKMTRMIQSGMDISPVITHYFPADEFQKAFDTVMSGDAAKVILEWT